MIKPIKPPNEEERLCSLLRLQMLDTAAEQRFDRATSLAARIFKVPCALVSLVDADRQWFKSRYGLAISEMPREFSFCGHAILSDQSLIVPDTLEDPRFRDNPAVVGELGIRFYAGSPLRTSDGYCIGTLCIFDTKPRTFGDEEVQMLKDLAAIVEGELEAVTLADALQRVDNANAERQRERQNFEAFMENTPCVVFIKDEKSRLQFVNRRFEEAFGISFDEVRGKADSEWLPAETAQQVLASDQRVFQTRANHEMEVSTPCANGGLRDWLCLKFPIPQLDGSCRLGGVAIDVTQQRRAEAAVKQGLSLKRAFLDSVEACIVATDTEGKITSVNSSAERMLGYAPDELVGRATPLLFLDSEEVREHGEELGAEGASVGFEALVHRARTGEAEERAWNYVCKDGSRFPVKLRVTALHDDAGEVSGFLTVARDITRDREVERTMTQAKEAAEQASEAKSRFLANMSHEIRTPLNGILGVNTMLLETALSSEQSRLASIVQESAESLLNIVDDILDFSKVEAGLIELEETSFSLSGLFSVVQRLHGVRASARGLVLETRIASEIPDRLLGDSARVRQVINNFVSNAMKFSERGKITISARAESFDRKGRVWVRICVQDGGIGVPPDAQQRIFDAFAQADGSTTRRYGGTGLGLSICRQLVQLMGGEIGVESEVGQGSTFWFTVRLRSAAAVEDEAEQEAVEEGMLIPGLRVLVAEDSTVNQMVILHELRRMGCTPEAVNNGREALRAVREGEYDLVLMDCQMPEMDGYEAAREIRRLPMVAPELPIIAITANAMVGERDRCMAAGMSGYLSKPFSRKQLRQVVMEALPESFMVGNEGAEPALGEDEVDALITESEEMGGELLRGLAEAFVVETTEALEALTLAARTQDGRRISAAAHKLRGSGSNFGARPLARLCDRMERYARADALTEAIALIPELRREAKRVIDSLNAILPVTAGAPVSELYP